MQEILMLLKGFGPTTLLIGLVIYCIRAVFTGQWVPRKTHEAQLSQMEKDRDYWRVTSEKWEKVAEGRIGLILDQQEAVTSITGHVVKSIREAGSPNVADS